MTTTGINVAGVQFRRAGRIYDFSLGDLPVKVGDDVVVETERGPSLAKVAVLYYAEEAELAGKELKPILRMATSRDLDETRKLTSEHAVNFARGKIEKLGLKMTLLQAEVQFGGNKVILYFSAPGRVDFRELVKELAGGLKARVELKQVGARDEAKLVGGIGICGREYCCSSWLRDFVPVSIKMAKNQNLALNPSKVSGGCGRLLCCLTYENDQYSQMRKQLPPKGTRVFAPADNLYGDVLKSDVLNQVVLIEADDGRQLTYPVAELEVVEKGAGVRSAVDEEAEIWGENIDFEALSGLGDDPKGDSLGSRKPSPKEPPRSRSHDRKTQDSRGRHARGPDRTIKDTPSDRRRNGDNHGTGEAKQDLSEVQQEGRRSGRSRRRGRGRRGKRGRSSGGSEGGSSS